MFLKCSFPEKVRLLLTPVIQAEMQNIAKNQKTALDGALLAVQVIDSTVNKTIAFLLILRFLRSLY